MTGDRKALRVGPLGERRSDSGPPPGEPDVIIMPLKAWTMLSIALPPPDAVAPKPEIEQ